MWYVHNRPFTALLTVDFFFQAEDGIRDYKVTGVQTCALPIYTCLYGTKRLTGLVGDFALAQPAEIRELQGLALFCRKLGKRRKDNVAPLGVLRRSEERRVGKECRSRRALEA